MKDLDSISGTIVDAAFHIHRTLGPGLLESVYEVVLAHELALLCASASLREAEKDKT